MTEYSTMCFEGAPGSVEESHKIFNNYSALAGILDQLWQIAPSTRCEAATECISNLSNLDWLLLGFLDINSQLNERLEIVDYNTNFDKILKVSYGLLTFQLIVDEMSSCLTEDYPIINYPNSSKTIIVKGVDRGAFKNLDIPVNRNPEKLLLALTYIKHHFDTLLLMPNSLRKSELDELSEYFELSVDQIFSLDRQIRKYCLNLGK